MIPTAQDRQSRLPTQRSRWNEDREESEGGEGKSFSQGEVALQKEAGPKRVVPRGGGDIEKHVPDFQIGKSR